MPLFDMCLVVFIFQTRKIKNAVFLSLMIFTQLYNYDKMYINLFLLCLFS